MFKTTLMVAALVSSLAAAASAQSTARRISFDIGFITTGLNDSLSVAEGTGSRGYGGQMGVSATFLHVLAFSGEGALMGVADNRKFQESTTGGVKKSRVAMATGTMAVGLRTPRLPDAHKPGVILGVDVGHTWLSVYRGIGECIDCTENHLNFDGAAFVEPRLAFTVNARGLEILLSYRSYASNADIKSQLLIGLGGGRYF